MKKNISLCLLLISLWGCVLSHSTPTKPNISYLYQIPSLSKQFPAAEIETEKGMQRIAPTEKEANFLFEQLYKRNPKLAVELGKLPECQDGISGKEVAALRNILGLYIIDPVTFDLGFDKMYKEGKPDVRKFCTPLQALFWLAEQDRLSRENNPLEAYELERILYEVWFTEYMFSKEEISEILNDIKHPEDRNYFELLSKDEVEFFLAALNKRPNSSSDFFKSGHKIFNGKGGKNKWTNFDEVTDRLNSPALVSFYIQQNIIYSREGLRLLGPRYVFKYKTGHCHEQSLLAAYCLERSGYDAVLVRAWASDWILGHTVVAYHDDGKLYKLDTSRRLGIVGPFKSYTEIAQEMAGPGVTGGLQITVLPWKSYASRPINR